MDGNLHFSYILSFNLHGYGVWIMLGHTRIFSGPPSGPEPASGPGTGNVSWPHQPPHPVSVPFSKTTALTLQSRKCPAIYCTCLPKQQIMHVCKWKCSDLYSVMSELWITTYIISELCTSTYIKYNFIVQGLGDEQHYRDSRGHLPASQQHQRFVSALF